MYNISYLNPKNFLDYIEVHKNDIKVESEKRIILFF